MMLPTELGLRCEDIDDFINENTATFKCSEYYGRLLEYVRKKIRVKFKILI